MGFAQLAASNWYISDEHNLAVTKYSADFSEESIVKDNLNGREWLVNNGELYVINNDTSEPKSLVKIDNDGNETLFLAGAFSQLSIRVNGRGTFVYHRVSKNEANIYQLHLDKN